MAYIEASTWNKKYKIPECKNCKTDMHWSGAMQLGMYNGGIALFDCKVCNFAESVEIKPNKEAKKKHKAWIKKRGGC